MCVHVCTGSAGGVLISRPQTESHRWTNHFVQFVHLYNFYTLCKSVQCQTYGHLPSHRTSPHLDHARTRLMALCPGLPGWAGTRKVKPIWILLKQTTVSGTGISWAICKSASCSREITTPVIKFFTGRVPFLPPNQQRQCNEGNSPHLDQ